MFGMLEVKFILGRGFRQSIFSNMLRNFLFFIFIGLISCKKNIQEPASFNSYIEIATYLDKANFKTDEQKDVSNSDWITSARFQSVDGQYGFLTLGMRGKSYYFNKVPISVWEQFKKSESKGSFYHKFIKNKYNINLSQNSILDQCQGRTKKGKRCKRKGTQSGYCFQHA